MQYLYENSMRINHDLLHEILVLPQNKLLDDLETALAPVVIVYSFTTFYLSNSLAFSLKKS